MSTEAVERPTWRDVSIDKLAQRLYAAHTTSTWNAVFELEGCGQQTIDAWTAVAEAAVDELIDRPEREFQAHLAAVVARNEPREPIPGLGWEAAKASDWL